MLKLLLPYAITKATKPPTSRGVPCRKLLFSLQTEPSAHNVVLTCHVAAHFVVRPYEIFHFSKYNLSLLQ